MDITSIDSHLYTTYVHGITIHDDRNDIMIQEEEGIESQTCSCTLHTNFVSNHSYSVIGDFLALQLLISFCTMLPP